MKAKETTQQRREKKRNRALMIALREDKKKQGLYSFRADVRPEVKIKLLELLIEIYEGYKTLQPQEAADLARFKRGMEK